jgi:FK506-binding protein 1
MESSESSSNVSKSKEGAGILIRTLKRPAEIQNNNDERPEPGDSVVVSYQGFLESSSNSTTTTLIPLERPSATDGSLPPPLEFVVGAGQVIEGLDVCVQRMNVDQQVEVTIPYLYAYGEQGYPPKIPPRSTLVYRITLLRVKKKATTATESS